MTKYLLLRLPGVLLVFGFLIIVHYMQFSVFHPKNRMGDFFNKISAESFDVFLVSTEEKRVSKDLIDSIVCQKDVEVKVHVLDFSGDLNFGNSEKVDYKKCASLELMDFFHREVLSIDPSHIVVVIDPLEKRVHPYLLRKIRHLFHSREVKAVYTDRKVKPTQKHPGWDQAKIKAYHVELIKQLDMEKIRTLEEYHQGILFLTDENFLFSAKLLDPDPENI
jgi:hypothetical protein